MSFRFGHRGQGRRHGQDRQNENCVCPSCNTVVAHRRGQPCFQTVCPQCGAAMTRQFNVGVVPPAQAQPEIPKPVVAPNFCTGCGKCLAVCAFSAIKIVDLKAVINPAACINCRACIPACPFSAIH